MRNPFAIKYRLDQSRKLVERKAFVGAYINEGLSELLSLYSLCRGEPKSVVIEEGLTNHLKKPGQSIEEMIELLSNRAILELRRCEQEAVARNEEPIDFYGFRTELFRNLMSVGISHSLTSRIINCVEKEHNETDNQQTKHTNQAPPAKTNPRKTKI